MGQLSRAIVAHNLATTVRMGLRPPFSRRRDANKGTNVSGDEAEQLQLMAGQGQRVHVLAGIRHHRMGLMPVDIDQRADGDNRQSSGNGYPPSLKPSSTKPEPGSPERQRQQRQSERDSTCHPE